MREDRLYFFQFPSPFPEFSSKKEAAMEVDPVPVPDATGKKVSFAADVKPDITPGSSRTASVVPSEVESAKAAPLDGVIGQLEVYKSGAVKIRLANGILLDVCPVLFTNWNGPLQSYFRSMPRPSPLFCNKLYTSIRQRNNSLFWGKSTSNLWSRLMLTRYWRLSKRKKSLRRLSKTRSY